MERAGGQQAAEKIGSEGQGFEGSREKRHHPDLHQHHTIPPPAPLEMNLYQRRFQFTASTLKGRVFFLPNFYHNPNDSFLNGQVFGIVVFCNDELLG
jgi:hypothetical protein